MRIKLWDRLLSALAGLMIVALGVGLLLFAVGVLPVQIDLIAWEKQLVLWQRVVLAVASALLLFIGVHCVTLLFRTKREKGFILQHTEYGDLSISMTAMENMVHKCVDTHSELKVNSTRIRHNHDNVIVELRISLASGVNIPIAVGALQKQIKQYITSCSGVDVKEVRVSVETNNAALSAAPDETTSMLAQDAIAAEKAGAVADSLNEFAQSAMPKQDKPSEEHEPIHQRLFKRGEEEQIIPPPPAPEATEDAAAEAEMPEATVDMPADDEPVAADAPTENEADEAVSDANNDETPKEEE